jgi:2'-5' RNA ligase
MRLFCGIDLAEDVRERLERLLMHLRPAAHLKWSPVYNLHITLKFIGEWPEEKLPQLADTLYSLPKRDPIPLEVRGLGWFPNPKNPRVFWAGVHDGAALTALASDIETALDRLGIAKETRPFSAHLTLARIKDPAPLDVLRAAIEQLESAEYGAFNATSYHLFRSQPGAAGSIYTKLLECPFQPA